MRPPNRKTTLGTIIALLVCIYLYDAFYHQSYFNQYDLHAEYYSILTEHRHLFVLEPSLLMQYFIRNDIDDSPRYREMINQKSTTTTSCSWLSHLWQLSEHSLTVGVFAGSFEEAKFNHGRFKEAFRTKGHLDYLNGRNATVLTHIYYFRKPVLIIGPTLHLHLVLLHPVKNFLWIGAIYPHLQPVTGPFPLSYGRYEQIFDPFELVSDDGITFPTDVPYFLAQLPASKYLYCPPELGHGWLVQNNVPEDANMERNSKAAILGIKGLMRQMRMQFWIAAGTLLGWYRSCSIIPYTTDSDFASWSRYVIQREPNLTKQLKEAALNHGIRLWKWLGEPRKAYECAFQVVENVTDWWHLDLFFLYQSKTRYHYGFHAGDVWTYQSFPKFNICSVQLNGHKLNAPCDPEAVIEAEYGNDWRQPNSEWSSADDPYNLGNWEPTAGNIHYLF